MSTLKASEDILNTLHQMVAKDLIERIKSGEANIQEINAAIKFLKDNDVVADITYSKPVAQLATTVQETIKLPFEVDPQEE